jgi:hypothetical protein
MFRKKLVVTWIVGIASTALPALSQSESPDKNEVSVQAFGSFVKSTTDNGIENKATSSGGVLGSYRYFFNDHSGVEANYGYSLNSQSYGLSSGMVGVKSYSHEILRIPAKKIAHSELKTIRASPIDAGKVIVRQVIVMSQEKG